MVERRYRRLWPGRQGWLAWLLDSPIPLRDNETFNWRTNRPVQIGDSFVLDIRKPNGRGRVIDKVEFRRGGYSSAEHPKQVKVTIQSEHQIVYDINLDTKRCHNIVLPLEQPAKVTFIAVKVTDIYPNTYWAVGDIRLCEVRLFSKCWRVNIK